SLYSALMATLFAALDDSLYSALVEALLTTLMATLFAALDDPRLTAVSVSGFAALLEGSCFESFAPCFERGGIVEGRGLEELFRGEPAWRIGQGSHGTRAAERSQAFLTSQTHAYRHLAHALAQGPELLEGDAIALRIPRLDVRPPQQLEQLFVS